MSEEGHNYKWGPPAKGWPNFTPEGKVVQDEDPTTISEADGDWEWCKGRAEGRRGNEAVCHLRWTDNAATTCDQRCQWDDNR